MRNSLIISSLLLSVLTLFGQEKYNSSAKKFFNEGLKAYNTNNYEEALQKFNSAITIEPNFSEAYLNRSIVYTQQAKHREALSDALRAYHLNGIQSAVFRQLGKSYYNRGNVDSAIFFLKKGMEAEIYSDEDLFYFANIQAELQEYDAALDAYTGLLKKHPQNSAVLNQRGIVFFKIGAYKKAEEDFLKALEHEPGNISIYENLSNAALDAKDTLKAIKYINLGMEKASGGDKVAFLILNGNYFFKNGNVEEAKNMYDQAFSIDKENPIVLANQASVLIKMQKFEEAVNKCTQAIEHDPFLIPALFNRGIAYEMTKNMTAACADWEEAFILGSTAAEEYLNSPACSE